jgi:hypothetical protein
MRAPTDLNPFSSETFDRPLGGRDQTAEKIVNAISSAGVEFIDENGGGAGPQKKSLGNERNERSSSGDMKAEAR